MQTLVDVPVELVGKSDPGRDPDKQVNEDHFRDGKSKFGPLAIVCDGMGGHAGGKEASALATATVFEEVEAAGEGETAGSALKRAIEIANRKVHALGQSGMHGRPGSTIVALLFHENGVEVAHVGDSRIYLVRGVECVQLTRDHSAVQLMVDAGVLTPEQAKVHPEANKITRALGIEAEVDVELRPHPFQYAPGDTFVLCSDGLSDLVDPEDFVRLVGGVPLAQAAGQLVDLANARGGHDNITALLVRAKGGSHSTGELRTQVMPAAGGGTGPVARTVLGAPIAAAAVAPGPGRSNPTMVMEPDARTASGGHPIHLPVAVPVHPGGPAPRRQGNASLVIGLVCAGLVLGILGTVLWFELSERSGHHHVTTLPSASPTVPAPAAARSLAPVDPTPPIVEDDEPDAHSLSEKLLPMGGSSSGGKGARDHGNSPRPTPPNPTPQPQN